MNWNFDGKLCKLDFLGIGVQKVGMMWLLQMLGQYLDVWMLFFKEVQFFNYCFVEEYCKWLFWYFKCVWQNIEKCYEMWGEELFRDMVKYLLCIMCELMFMNYWYKLVFVFVLDDVKIIDVMLEYLILLFEGVEFVLKFLFDVKFIYIICYLVDRVILQMKMNLMCVCCKFVLVEEWLIEVCDLVLLDCGDYQIYVLCWNVYFGVDWLLYLFFGMILCDFIGFLWQVEGFLGLKLYDYCDVGKKVFVLDNSFVVFDVVCKVLCEMLEL